MATITVTNLSDNDSGSLRQAILNANSGDTINFAPGLAGGTLTLTSGELDITKNVTIDGFIDAAGTPLITINAAGNSRVIYVADGTNANPTSVTLNALTIEGGYLPHATGGGGIGVGRYDSLIIGDSHVTGNEGAISVDVSSTLTLLRSTVDHNSASFGGGIDAFHATVNVVDSTLSDNSATFGGGAVEVEFGTLMLVNATLAGNSANGGSAINADFSTVALYDSSVTGNASGAIIDGNSLTLSNSIVAGNGDTDLVGTPLVLKGNSILGSPPPHGTSIDTTNGSYTQIDGTSQAALQTVFAQVGNNPDTGVLSGVLAKNGGLVETVAINPAGIADNAGSNAALPPDTFDLNQNNDTAEPLPVDARGFTRVSGGTVDIGAFEQQQPTPFDVNGDFLSDLVFQNNGTPGIWLWNGAAPTAEVGYANPGASWHIITSHDVDGDGNADLIWQNSDGTPGIWLMNGTTPLAEVGFSNPGATWRVVASGDTNADGKSDLIWQNTNGTLGVWLMNGTTPIVEAGISNPGATWKVVGAADFNADGRDDILLQDTVSGNLMVDVMNGTSIASTVSLTVGDPSWHAVSVGEFNGQAEIAWQNSNGTPGLWLMNSTAPAAEVGLPNPGAGWQLLSVDHFTPNGQADLLFQNSTNDTMQLWETNGTSLVAQVNLPNPGAGWQLVNGHPFASG